MLSVHGRHKVREIMKTLSRAQVSKVLHAHVFRWLGLAVKSENIM